MKKGFEFPVSKGSPKLGSSQASGREFSRNSRAFSVRGDGKLGGLKLEEDGLAPDCWGIWGLYPLTPAANQERILSKEEIR